MPSPPPSLSSEVIIFQLLLFCVEIVNHSGVSNSATPWTVTRQAPLSMEFSRQEHWSGELFPSLGDLLNSGIKPASPALQANFFYHLSHQGSLPNVSAYLDFPSFLLPIMLEEFSCLLSNQEPSHHLCIISHSPPPSYSESYL